MELLLAILMWIMGIGCPPSTEHAPAELTPCRVAPRSLGAEMRIERRHDQATIIIFEDTHFRLKEM
ncbi:MAG: hypothetical protein OHK0039_00530 [Bacteroidia bacterium]